MAFLECFYWRLRCANISVLHVKPCTKVGWFCSRRFSDAREFRGQVTDRQPSLALCLPISGVNLPTEAGMNYKVEPGT